MFLGRHPADTADDAAFGWRAVPESATRELGGDLAVILDKATSSDPERRYQSVAEFSDDLQRFRSGEPIHARPPTTLYRAGRFVLRNKALVAALTATAVALIVGIIVALTLAADAQDERRRADHEAWEARQIATAATHQAASSALQTGDVAAARQLLSSVPLSDRGWPWAYLAAQLDSCAAYLPFPRSDALADGRGHWTARLHEDGPAGACLGRARRCETGGARRGLGGLPTTRGARTERHGAGRARERGTHLAHRRQGPRVAPRPGW